MTDHQERPLDPHGEEPEPRRPSPFAIPELLDVEITRVRFRDPRPYYVGPERFEAVYGVEFRIRTDGPIPIRALSPLLIVGEVEIDAYDDLGENRYRFTAFAVDDLQEGAPITLGWTSAPPRSESRFRYVPGAEVDER